MVERRREKRRRVGSRRQSRYGEVQDAGTTKAGYREPDIASSFAKRVESVWDSDSSDGIGTFEIYSSQKVPTALTEVTNSTTCSNDLTAKRNSCARTEFPNYAVVHRKRVRNDAEGCVIVGSLK